MSEKKELKSEDLEKVSGGDNGDYKLEWSADYGSVKYRYQVEQYVEVYNNGFHVTTTRRKIEDRRPLAYKGGWVGEYKFLMSTDLGGEKHYEWKMADEIQT